MTALVPETVKDAVDAQDLFSASESFGVVVLVTTVVVLLVWQGLSLAGDGSPRRAVLAALAAPLMITLGLVLAARIGTIAT